MTSADRNGSFQLVASTRVDVLDLYRVPYDVVPAPGDRLLRVGREEGPALVWPAAATRPVHLVVDGIPIFAPVVPEREIAMLLSGIEQQWETCSIVRHPGGSRVSSVRRAADGTVFIPFDPNHAVRALLSEDYVPLVSGVHTGVARNAARRAYYRLRPVMPRRMQIALRRRFADLQRRSTFPDWPAETGLHDLQEWLLGVVQEVVGQPLPQIDWWPDGRQWAVVITHDVERAAGYALVEELAGIDRAAGLRSAWYFVPERDYSVSPSLLERLRDDGFEVGVHGLRHDGRDLLPGVFERRVSAMQSYASDWDATGFRAPSTQRSWEIIAGLGFDYDSSYSDIARFEPQGGGACTWLPFFIGDVVELPMTLPMDHTLFELLGETDATVWIEKAAFLRERGALALILTHPDYLATPGARAAYTTFLDRVGSDPAAWRALPREVSDWWRRRNESRVKLVDGEWYVEGPAEREAGVVVRDRPSPLVPSKWVIERPSSQRVDRQPAF